MENILQKRTLADVRDYLIEKVENNFLSSKAGNIWDELENEFGDLGIEFLELVEVDLIMNPNEFLEEINNIKL